MAKTLGLFIRQNYQIVVTVASGESVKTIWLYQKLQWSVLESVFIVDFMVFSVKGCDIILRVQ